MSEAILIEIMQRFRRLEDKIEAADLFLASNIEDYENKIAKAEADHSSGEISYGTYCRRTIEPEADLNNLEGIRQDVGKFLDACRDDMNRMQDEIRSRQRSMAA